MQNPPFTYASYIGFLRDKRLMASRCTACGSFSLPPRPICPACRSQAMEWVEMPTRGKLLTFTCIYVAPTRMVDHGYGRQNPYCTGVVELENGARLAAQVTGLDPKLPEAIPTGLPVVAEFILPEPGQDGPPRVNFRPLD